MGGMQTFQITFDHLGLFSYIGGFSGAARVLGNEKVDTKSGFNGAMDDPTALTQRVHLLWIVVGTAEPARMHDGIVRLHDALTQAGIKHVFYERRARRTNGKPGAAI